MTEFDLTVNGRTLHVHDTGAAADRPLAVFWHHGTPNTGASPEPLFPAAARLGIRWVSYDRPGYGRSTPEPNRRVGSAGDLVTSVADELGIARFAVMGHSGGGSHAVACGALLSDRVLAVVSIAGPAPFGAEELDSRRRTSRRLPAAGRGYSVSSAMLRQRDKAGWSTTTSPTSPLGSRSGAGHGTDSVPARRA